jgi:hypothetical protein
VSITLNGVPLANPPYWSGFTVDATSPYEHGGPLTGTVDPTYRNAFWSAILAGGGIDWYTGKRRPGGPTHRVALPSPNPAWGHKTLYLAHNIEIDGVHVLAAGVARTSYDGDQVTVTFSRFPTSRSFAECDCHELTPPGPELCWGTFSFPGGLNHLVPASPSINLPERKIKAGGPSGIATTGGVLGAGDGYVGGSAFATGTTFLPTAGASTITVHVWGNNTTSGTATRYFRFGFWSGSYTGSGSLPAMGSSGSGFTFISSGLMSAPTSGWVEFVSTFVVPAGATAMKLNSGLTDANSFVSWDELSIYCV